MKAPSSGNKIFFLVQVTKQQPLKLRKNLSIADLSNQSEADRETILHATHTNDLQFRPTTGAQVQFLVLSWIVSSFRDWPWNLAWNASGKFQRTSLLGIRIRHKPLQNICFQCDNQSGHSQSVTEENESSSRYNHAMVYCVTFSKNGRRPFLWSVVWRTVDHDTANHGGA